MFERWTEGTVFVYGAFVGAGHACDCQAREARLPAGDLGRDDRETRAQFVGTTDGLQAWFHDRIPQSAPFLESEHRLRRTCIARGQPLVDGFAPLPAAFDEQHARPRELEQLAQGLRQFRARFRGTRAGWILEMAFETKPVLSAGPAAFGPQRCDGSTLGGWRRSCAQLQVHPHEAAFGKGERCERGHEAWLALRFNSADQSMLSHGAQASSIMTAAMTAGAHARRRPLIPIAARAVFGTCWQLSRA